MNISQFIYSLILVLRHIWWREPKLIVIAGISVVSVDSSGKEEMLYNWHNLDLTQIGEEFIKFVLAGAVKNQVCTEYEDASSQDGDYV